MEDSSDLKLVIAKNLKKVMRTRSLRSSDLCKLCEISSGTMSKIVAGQMNVSITILLKLARGLELDLPDFLEGIYSPPKKQKESDKKQVTQLFAGILTIGDRRITSIQDEAGKVVGNSELEGSLVLTDSFPNFINLIKKSIASALNEESDNIDYSLFKVAAVAHCYELEETRSKYQHHGEQSFKSLEILADWQITYLSAFSNDQGMSIVVDKGVSLAFKANGQLHKLGGWGFPTYDIGGEYWLGLMTVHHTIEAQQGLEPKTPLSKKVITKYDGKLEKLVEFCLKNNKTADVYCTFYDQLINSYLSGEEKAKEILLAGYTQIERLINQADKVAGRKLKISLNGSMARYYKEFIDQKRLIKDAQESEKASLLAEIAKTGFKV